MEKITVDTKLEIIQIVGGCRNLLWGFAKRKHNYYNS